MATPTFVCPIKEGRLLLCTDGSPNSRGAVAGALALAQSCACKLYLLQVLEVSLEIEAMAPDVVTHLLDEVRENLQGLKEEAARRGIEAEVLVRSSEAPYAVILKEAEKISPGMIIVGRYGHTGLARVMMGSVTARVIGHSPFPVLVVPEEATLAFRRILVASDGSPYSAAAWQEALAMAKRTGAGLLALSVAREAAEREAAAIIVAEMEHQAKGLGLSAETLVLEGRPYEAIVRAALGRKADLIVMGSHGRTGLKRLLMGSVTERVIGQSPCPVLVVKGLAE